MLAAVAAALLAPAARPAAADPVTIRSGFTVMVSGFSPLVLEKKDLMKHYGQSYVLEPRHFQSTSLELTALASGEADIVSLGYSTLAVAVLNAHLDDVRVVADANQDGAGGHKSVPFMVTNDGGIAKIEDLKGKVIATNGAGGAFDVAMRWMLHEHGLDDKRDYNAIETDYANMPAMLLSRKAALIIGANPWALNPEIQAKAHTLFTAADTLGASQMTVQAARAGFIAAHRAAMVDFFEDMMRVIRWFRDPANHDAAVAIAANLTKQPASSLSPFLFTKEDSYVDPKLHPDLASLARNIGVMKSLGFINATIDVKKYSDLTLVEEAAQRLPEPTPY
ncbi:MAG TPA: ABC transporter substrate-binding protein [Stellaceae bacterium]|nr:ABC transporter substrate-binding protein [Stellaceae bacterium]